MWATLTSFMAKLLLTIYILTVAQKKHQNQLIVFMEKHNYGTIRPIN